MPSPAPPAPIPYDALGEASSSRPLSCLLLTSHPDDDAIFAGELQRRLSAQEWTVVSVTHDPDSLRGREMLRWQAMLGTGPERVHFLGQPDDPEDRRQGRCTIEQAEVERRLNALGLEPSLVVTHNARGEYGHPHHVLTHRVARTLFPAVPTLVFGSGLEATDLALACAGKWERVLEAYPSQAAIVEKLRADVETFAWVRAASGHPVR